MIGRLLKWTRERRAALRLYLTIICGAVVILALTGIFVTASLPEKVRHEETLLQYQQKSDFDYAVHMEPSPLNGMTPAATYPAAIVNNMAFTYTYQQVEKETETVSIEAVMENPGIWRKVIPLVAETDVKGDFSISFSLDLIDIRQKFAVIEEELKLPDNKRDLTVYARVKSSQGLFIQALPLKISETLVEVSNDLIYSRLWCSGAFQYTVNLAPSSAFDTTTVASPVFDSALTTLRPGPAVPARLARGMEVSLDYGFSALKPVRDLTSEIEVTSILETGKLGSRTFPVLNTTRNGDFKLYFPIDLAGYLQTLDAAGTEAGPGPDASTLTIAARVHTTGMSEFGPVDAVQNPVLKGSIKGNLITWDGELSQTQPGAISEVRYLPNPDRYLGLSVEGVRNLAWIVFGIFVIFLGLLIFRKPGLKSGMPLHPGKENTRILKKYRSRIVESLPGYYYNAENSVLLGSFEDLLKVSDDLGKPILHHLLESGEKYHAYAVPDGDTNYLFVVNEEGEIYVPDQGSSEPAEGPGPDGEGGGRTGLSPDGNRPAQPVRAGDYGTDAAPARSGTATAVADYPIEEQTARQPVSGNGGGNGFSPEGAQGILKQPAGDDFRNDVDTAFEMMRKEVMVEQSETEEHPSEDFPQGGRTVL